MTLEPRRVPFTDEERARNFYLKWGRRARVLAIINLVSALANLAILTWRFL